MDQLFLQRVYCLSFVFQVYRLHKRKKSPRGSLYILSMNLNKYNLLPVLFLLLSKADIYLLKYPFSYQVPVQYLITAISKREVTVLTNTNKSAIDSQLKAMQEKIGGFSPTYAKSGQIKQAGGKRINRSYKSEKESERLKLGGEYLQVFLLKMQQKCTTGLRSEGGTWVSPPWKRAGG